MAVHAKEPVVLLESRVTDSAQGWQPKGEALLSDITRVPGGHSLLLKQWADDQQESHWLSPEIANPGKPVTIGCDTAQYLAAIRV